MAAEEPPIIISNGGVAEALAEGLIAKKGDKREPYKIILDNVAALNKRCNTRNKDYGVRPVGRSLRKGAGARIYWRLAREVSKLKHASSNARIRSYETGRDAQ